MLDILRKFLFIAPVAQNLDEKDDFADFFLRASAGEKKSFFKKAITKANKDQQRYLRIYEEGVKN